MSIDYLVFFSLILVAIVIGIKHKTPEPDPVSQGRLKCESPIERRLYDALTRNGYHVSAQVKCGKYRIDLAIKGSMIAIECDGAAYHSSPKAKERDRRKNAYLKASGWKVIRVSGKRIYRDMKGILLRVEKEMR